MRRLATLAATALVVLVPAQAAAAKVRKGPSGNSFYTAPSPLPGKAHGDLIWARKLTNGAALPAASVNWLVLYRSTGSDGKPIAVSGVVSLPKTKAPKSGWKSVTWDHGTSGIADVCAPSRDNGSNAAHTFQAYSYPLLSTWLKDGYAVVRTDYQGLGTPGTHHYLGGVDEGRSTLDIVRAARQLDPRVGKTFAIAGHSQGGHAALWAADLAPKWTPELKLRGTVAFAPASHISEQAALVQSLNSPGTGLEGLVALILGGLDAQDPALHLKSQLSDAALALYPQIETKCLDGLGAKDSFGGLAISDDFGSNFKLPPLVAALDKNDPENLSIKGAPIDIEQGLADTTVSPSYTNPLVDELRKNGAKVSYSTYPNTDHVGVVTTAAPKHATAFIVKRLGK